MTLEDKINVIYNWVLTQQGEHGDIICDIRKFTVERTYTEIAEDILVKLGVSRSLSGFNYMIWAVAQAAENEGIMRNMVKNLYTDGGKHFGTSCSSFERAIRNLVDNNLRNEFRRAPLASRIFGENWAIIDLSNKAVIATLAAAVKKEKKNPGTYI